MGSKQLKKYEEQQELKYLLSDEAEETNEYSKICIHCGKLLIGKQQKFCSIRCGRRERNKKWK
jgi:hypothetical protein